MDNSLLLLQNFSGCETAVVRKVNNPNKMLKIGVWAYFLLLLFEGGLRKWVLPGLSNQLLIVRDPVALFILLSTWRRGLLPTNIYLSTVVIVGIIGIFTAMLLGHGNLYVTLYGARILLIHFPFIFAIGRIFNRTDVIKIGKFAIWIALPMAILIALQFYSPQSALVNRGVGGSLEGGGFNGGALGFYRPGGTFSFTNGNALFFGFVAPFVFYFWLYPIHINRLPLVAATLGLLIAIPISISRTLLFEVGIAAAFTVVAIAFKPKFTGKLIGASFGIIIGLAILSQFSFFQTATEAFSVRFTGAQKEEGGFKGVLGDRYFGGLISGISGSANKPFFGYGLGIGSSVGSVLINGSEGRIFSEEDWGRTVGEMGALLGLLIIFARVGLSIKLALASYLKLRKGDLLPWLLLSYGLLLLPQGEWAQPTALGFSTLIGGLLIASLRVPTEHKISLKTH